jgi:SAM-dependent methyltransferase
VTDRPADRFPKSDYREYPKTLAPDDFWGQVRRTVNGKPVSDEQILMMVRAIRANLELGADDTLLDLACGNGALSRYFFDDCRQSLGVDHSEYLIEIAKANFERAPDHVFSCSDACAYVRAEPSPKRFTKALCYGSFSFFPAADADIVLATLRQRFTNLRRILLGNLPDKARAGNFYPPGKDYSNELDDHAAQIGIWRSSADLEALAARTGWRIKFLRMPPEFFGAHYRFDALLEPLEA